MELVKCVGFVYGISALLTWMTHTDLKNPTFSNALQKRPNRGRFEIKGCFLTLPAKTAHKPNRWDSGGLSGFAAYWSSRFLLF